MGAQRHYRRTIVLLSRDHFLIPNYPRRSRQSQLCRGNKLTSRGWRTSLCVQRVHNPTCPQGSSATIVRTHTDRRSCLCVEWSVVFMTLIFMSVPNSFFIRVITN